LGKYVRLILETSLGRYRGDIQKASTGNKISNGFIEFRGNCKTLYRSGKKHQG
jgi:hypothetical protein